MALSYVTYIGNGATTTYNYGSISVLKDGVVPVVSQLVVTIDDVAVPASTYSVNTVTSNLTFFTAPSTDAVVVITRVTKSDDRYVDWTNSTNLSQEQLNLDSDQLLFLAQEGLDSAQLTIRLNALNKWDAEGNVISNVAIGTDSNDAVNVQQLNAAVFGGTPGVVTGQQYLRSDDGSTVFSLPSLHGQAEDDVNVFKDGIRLAPTDDYTVADGSDGSSLILTLGSNPGSSLIEITFVTGIMAASLGDDTITNESIKDGVITPDKLANAGARKVLINNPSTGPEWADLTASDVNAANNVDLPTHSLSELAVPTGDLSVGNVKITSVADPTNVQDAVNLQTLQNQIATLQSQITGAQSFGVGTVCGTLVILKSYRRASSFGGYQGAAAFWQDGQGKDFHSNTASNWIGSNGIQGYDMSLQPKGGSWPLDADLTFMSKNPSTSACDVDLVNSIPLASDVGFFNPGANNPGGSALAQSIPRSVVTTGGKIFQLLLPPDEDELNILQPGPSISPADNVLNTGIRSFDTNPSSAYRSFMDVTALTPSGSSISGGIVKFYFPYTRVS